MAIFAYRGAEKVLGRNIERTAYALQIAMDNRRGHGVKNMKSFCNTSNLRILGQAEHQGDAGEKLTNCW